MVAKIMSSVSLMCAVGLYLLNSSNPADPMFFIVSGDRTIATARIGLALLMSVSAFAVVLRKRSYRLGTGIFGAVLVASALAFLTVSWFNYSLSDYAKPMDLVMGRSSWNCVLATCD